MTNAYISVEKREGKRLLGRARGRWKNNTTKDVKEIG
jgi:hypothetical protein